MHADELAFLRGLQASPGDDLPRLIYAEWLDEHGQPERAAYLRAECALANAANAREARPPEQRLAELHPVIDVNWRAAVSRTTISLCQASVPLPRPRHFADRR